MKNEIETIIKKLEDKTQLLESTLSDIIKDAPAIISVLEEGFAKLKEKVSSYRFRSQDEEIKFFKETKPRIFSKLIYYHKLYHIALCTPVYDYRAQKCFFNKELETIRIFYNVNTEFIQYYRSGKTLADQYYFLRGKKEITLNLDSSYYERDICFSTIYDFRVAEIMANDMLAAYLNHELSKLEYLLYNTEQFTEFSSEEKWTDTKAALVELIYAIHSAGSINSGNVDLKTLAFLFEKMFNIKLGDIYHVFLEVRNRKTERTVYLNKLIRLLNERMDEADL